MSIHFAETVSSTTRLPGVGVNTLVHAQGKARPDALAVCAPDATLTYGELLGRATALSTRLRDAGIGPEDPVGLCLPRSAALVVGALAILDAGAAYVAMDPSYPEQRLSYMLANSGAKALVATTAPAGGPPVVQVDAATGPVADPVPGSLPGSSGGARLAYVIYTSGSSGFPKGVMVAHDGLRCLVDWHCRAFGVTAADRSTQVYSPGFDASVWEMWPYLAAGASIHIPDDELRADPMALRDWMVDREITIALLPTALAEAQLVLHWPATAPLRTVLTGGDALHRRPPAELPFTFVNNYGLTEATVVSTSGAVAPEPATGVPTIGRPVDHTDLYLVDADLRPVPDGVVGEILIGGPMVARGYLNDPALTASRFVPDHLGGRPGARLLRTVDLGRRRPDGRIEFLGRSDNQVKVHGYRIELDEIAAALTRHPAVYSSVVVARARNFGERGLCAYVVPHGERVDDRTLDEFLAGVLPAYMLPGGYVWLDELPLTPNGKVDRDALPSPESVAAMNRTLRPPRTQTEAALVPVVAGLLQLDSIGIDENFFHLGGHSMLAAQLIMRVDDEFEVPLSLGFLFDHPTVEAMAAEIDRVRNNVDGSSLAGAAAEDGGTP